MTKQEKFEYILDKLVEWYKEKSSIESNDFSKLKVLKLHFFVCSASSLNNDSGDDLFVHFDKFVAMPYGHVEEDVYNFILKNETNSYTVDDSKTNILSQVDFPSNDFTSLVDNTLRSLRTMNNDLVCLDAFRLVELSHNWFSWKYYFNSAQKIGKSKGYIPVDVLRKENKYFIIQKRENELHPVSF